MSDFYIPPQHKKKFREKVKIPKVRAKKTPKLGGGFLLLNFGTKFYVVKKKWFLRSQKLTSEKVREIGHSEIFYQFITSQILLFYFIRAKIKIYFIFVRIGKLRVLSNF